MKRKHSICTVLLTLSILCSFLVNASCDASDSAFTFLDSMSVDEMTSLIEEAQSRIAAKKAAEGASDPSNTGIWTIKYYVDEFNNPTEDGYITTKEYVRGTFSNSATTNSDLLVVWLIDKDDVAIKLAEYGRSVVKSSYSSTDYSIVMLDPDGKKVTMTGKMYKGGDRIYFDSQYESTIIDALKQNGSITIKISELGKYASSSYLFKMEDTSFFENAYSRLK